MRFLVAERVKANVTPALDVDEFAKVAIDDLKYISSSYR